MREHDHGHSNGGASHGHSNGGASHGHAHGVGHDHTHGASERRVAIAAVLVGVFMLAEVAGGILSGSLALLADAGHMLTDFASLVLAWLAFRLARRPADAVRTYGFDRAQVLVAFVNGLTLFLICGWIVWEAVTRLFAPQPVLGGLMLVVAVLGFLVNVAAFLALHGADRDNMNVRGAMLHVLGDLLGSVAAIGGAVVILTTGWTPIDPILSILVAGIVLRSAWSLVAQSAHVLLEGAPTHVDAAAIPADLAAQVPGVEDVHHVHAWSITPERPMVTLHARLSDGADADAAIRAIKARLRTRFSIDHATVEIERGACADHGRRPDAACVSHA